MFDGPTFLRSPPRRTSRRCGPLSRNSHNQERFMPSPSLLSIGRAAFAACLFGALSCGGGDKSPGVTAAPPRVPASFDVSVVLAPGVEGSPGAGILKVDSGSTLAYSYRAAAGYTALRVWQDAKTLSPSGSFQVGKALTLVAAADVAVTLSADAQALVTQSANVLTAADAHQAFQQLDAPYRALLSTGGPAALTTLGLVRREAFRDAWDNGTMSAFWRRLSGDFEYAPSSQAVRFSGAAAVNSTPVHQPFVGYINGILNDPGDAATSWIQISELAYSWGYNSTYKYNKTWSYEVGGGYTNCLFARARVVELAALFSCTSLVKDLVEAKSQLENVLAGEPAAVNSFALSLRDWIASRLDAGQSLVLVAHSQGNLMVQEALSRFFAQRPAVINAAAKKCIAIVSVAAPTSSGFAAGVDVEGTIAKGGVTKDILLIVPALNFFPTTSSNITADADVAFALAFPPALALETAIGIPVTQWLPYFFGVYLHFMSSSYLAGDLTREWIRLRIGLLGNRLAKNCTDVATITPGSLALSVGAVSDLAAERFTPSGKKQTGATFTWTSTDPSVVRVESSPPGRVTGLKAGVATVTATSGDAVAAITVTVATLGATIALSPAAIAFATAVGGVNPSTQVVQITNGGTGTLSGLTLGAISYAAGQPTGWLTTTTLSSATAPATLTLGVSLASLAPGTYSATLPVTANGAVNSRQIVSVSFTIVGVSLSFSSVTAGRGHTCGVTTADAAYCWGGNFAGQLGDGTTMQRLTPALIAGNLALTNLNAGAFHTCGMISSGAAYCWGLNDYGQLGDGTSQNQRSTPALVAGNLIFTSLSTGYSHTCGMTSNGAAYCWGLNTFGNIGDGTTMQRSTPTLVAGNLTFASLSAGYYYTCGVTTSGAAYCWGSNTYGNLGDGTTTARYTPVAIAGNLTFRSLSTGYDETCGVTTNGAAYCWGYNTNGGLGDGTTIRRSTPMKVAGNLSFTSLSVAGDLIGYSCGVTTSGAAYCWGDNYWGQLGDGTTMQRSTPTLVAGNLAFTSLSASNLHTCGLIASGAAYCWGFNSSGELGDGTWIPRSTPTPVRIP